MGDHIRRPTISGRILVHRAPQRDPFHSYDRIREISKQVLAASVADETELVWFERRHGNVSTTSKQGALESPRLTILVRVVDGKRMGWHRAETADRNLLESGVRQAMALSRVQPPVKRRPVMPTTAPQHDGQHLRDQEIVSLSPTRAHDLLTSWCGGHVHGSHVHGTDAHGTDVHGSLHWSETRVAVFNSHGLRRRAETTEVTLSVQCGRGQSDGGGAGYSTASTRSLDALAPEEIVQRALQRRGEGTVAELPAHPLRLLFAPEAVVELINVLNMFSLSGRSYLEGTSFLSRHRNEQVFDRSFNLRDDATNTRGIPFPFDLEGSLKAPLDLIVEGRPFTPALDRNQGAQAGLASTAQAVGGGDSFFGNLFMLPGETSTEDLLSAAEGGVHISHLDPPECLDPSALHLRARVRGVRRIEGGRLGAPLPDLMWEGSLLGAFARLRAVGSGPIVRSTSSTPMGAISAPAVVLMESDGLRGL